MNHNHKITGETETNISLNKMPSNKHIDKFWSTLGILIIITVGIISWCIFLIVKKPISNIVIEVLSVLFYLLYIIASIVLLEKWNKE